MSLPIRILASLLLVHSAVALDHMKGRFAAFQSPGCTVEVTAELDRAASIRYSNASTGPCGVYVRVDIDIRTHPRLSFRHRGADTAVLRVADPELQRREDSVPVGRLESLPVDEWGGGWKRRLVSLPVRGLTGSEVSTLAWTFPEGSSGTLEVADLFFSAATYNPPPPHAMWFWEFADCLDNINACKGSFDIARRAGVDTLFAQIDWSWVGGRAVLRQPERLRELLGLANASGLRIHALDGAPEYALRRYHPQMLSLTRAVLDFNRASAPNARFAGLHLDIEPYLLPGYDARVKPVILRDYLELHQSIANLIHASDMRIEFGADIPFWLGDLGHQLMDVLDNVGIMDYRNAAFGPDGIVEHAREQMEYAGKIRRKVYIGVETIPQKPGTHVLMPLMPEKAWQALRDSEIFYLRKMGRYRVTSHSDGETRYVGLTAGDGGTSAPDFQAALLRLARQTGAKKLPMKWKGGGEYTPVGPYLLPGFEAMEFRSKPLAKLSFAGQSKGEMNKILKTVEDFFAGEPAFAGIAIHSLSSWDLLPADYSPVQ